VATSSECENVASCGPQSDQFSFALFTLFMPADYRPTFFLSQHAKKSAALSLHNDPGLCYL